MTRTRPRGRPKGGSSAPADILRSARELFAELGFDRTTIRAIAARAGVDPASVHHHYGTKRELLAAALRLPFDPEPIAASLEGTRVDARAFVTRALAVWERPDTRLQLRALLRIAVSDEEAAAVVRDLFTREIVAALSKRSPAPDAELRAALVATQMAGLAMLRFVVPVAAVAAADVDTIVAAVAPTIERYLDPDVPVGPAA